MKEIFYFVGKVPQVFDTTKLTKYLPPSLSSSSSYHHHYIFLLYFIIINIVIFFFTSPSPTSSLSSSSSSILHHTHFLLLLLLLNDIFHLMTLKLHTYMMRNYCQTSCIHWLKSTESKSILLLPFISTKIVVFKWI